MDFNEKLVTLRKQKGWTQEELAKELYVSRTAVSKWESGRGYPSIDSLKEISGYFSVSIDELLSGEKLISIAERENKSNIRSMCVMLIGMVDLLSVLLILLPLYPKTVEGYVYAVNLFAYTEVSAFNLSVYWALFASIVLLGVLQIVLTQLKTEKHQRKITTFSMALSIAAVCFLGLAGETYAVTFTFLMLVIKAALLFKCEKAER